MDEKSLRFKFTAPLQPGDTGSTTFGCRAKNPDYCKNVGLSGRAFIEPDHICCKPSNRWARQYRKYEKQFSFRRINCFFRFPKPKYVQIPSWSVIVK